MGLIVSAPVYFKEANIMNYLEKCECYIHSLKKDGQNKLAEATILKKIGDNQYLADYNGVKCTAIFNPFICRYYVDDIYGVQ